jgi:pimeloyl-ACP methyl ester carboxylesterase
MNGEQFIEVRGKRLFVSEAGAGRPVLLVHGFPLDRSMWAGQMEGLSDRLRLIAVDLPGFGQSFATLEGDEPVLGMDAIADDLAALLDELNVAGPVAFCGLSMGGYVAWQFWKRHRARLGRLILCDTRAAADSPAAAQERRQFAAKALDAGSKVVADRMLPKLFGSQTVQEQPELVERTRQTMLATKPATLAAALRGMAERADFTSQLGEIDVPALVICGEHDAISPPAEMRGIASAMPNATFELIEGAGHMAPLESPAAVNHAIARFLS